MFNDAEKNLLIKKRYAELECIGIDPVLYFNVVKYLNRCLSFSVKDGIEQIYQKSKHMYIEDIGTLIMDIFGVDDEYTSLIIVEWKRDRLIYHNMMEKQTKYYDYLTLSV